MKNPIDINYDTALEYRDRICKVLRGYIETNGFQKVVVGCSGGIDSALTIALAAQAIGARNVQAITMPSPFSSAGSADDSKTLCANLDVDVKTVPIHGIVAQISETLRRHANLAPQGLALENLQARVRGVLLMTYSNMNGHLVLATGNRSETMVGYCTLYGDTCGGMNLIGNLYKTQVYALARAINLEAGSDLIPLTIIEKAPSAELAPGQKDSDSLPDYDQLDCAIEVLAGPAHTASAAMDYLGGILSAKAREGLLERVRTMMDKSEFKRRQLPPSVILGE